MATKKKVAKKKATGFLQEEPKTIVYIPIDDLVYDPDNPRLPHTIVDGRDEPAVINWMLSDASILELMGSIGLKGFFAAEPLLVVKTNTKKRIVVEGNRRLTAVKLLHHPELAVKRAKAVQEIAEDSEVKPPRLPAIEYDTREEILDYLGFKHITGVKPWPALAKAKYLQQLQPEYKSLSKVEQYRALAKAIGSRSDYVRDLLNTVELYDLMDAEDFFGIEGLKEDTIEFGVYYNAMKYSHISKYVGVDNEKTNPNEKVNLKKLKEVASWISEVGPNNKTRLGESRNLGKLNEILAPGAEKALEMFRSGRPLEEAVLYTGEPTEQIKQAINDSFSQLQFANNSSFAVERPSQSEIKTLQDIQEIAEQLEVTFTYKLNKASKAKAKK